MNDNGAHNSVSKPKKVVGRPFTPMNAKEAQEASVRARNLRKQVRAEMLDKLVSNLDLGDEMLKAIKKGDLDKINLLQTALRIVGLTHDQSEDAVTKLALDAKTENKTELSGEIKFVLPQQK